MLSTEVVSRCKAAEQRKSIMKLLGELAQRESLWQATGVSSHMLQGNGPDGPR